MLLLVVPPASSTRAWPKVFDPQFTWNKNRSLLCKPGTMGLHVEMAVLDAAATEALKKEKCSS
eukprot:4648124-Pleurochrysis_carterae.AAC.1